MKKFSLLIWLLFGVLLIRQVLVFPYIASDTAGLLEGGRVMLACLGQGLTHSCAGVSSFPAAQHALTLPLLLLGLSDQVIEWVLVILSLLACIGTFYLTYKDVRREQGEAAALVATLALMSGPIFLYGRSTFFEMAAAFSALFLARLIYFRKGPAVILALAIWVGISKETALPFIALLALAARPELFLSPIKNQKTLVFLAMGAVIAFGINSLFNYFRYGVIYNTAYLLPFTIITDPSRNLSAFLALWFSPNGGILFFWSAFFACMVACVAGALRQKNRSLSARSLPGLAAVALMFALTLGLSRWWAPFGWHCWGPRLMLPWIPPLIYVLFCHYGKGVEAVSIRKLRVASAILGFSAMIQFFGTSQINAYTRWFFALTGPCASGGPECVEYLFWSHEWIPVKVLRELVHVPIYMLHAGVFILIWFWIYRRLESFVARDAV